jgi:hypothetical protein
MKYFKLSKPSTLAAILLAATPVVNAQQTYTVDPTQNWIGYMNVFELPQNGGGYDFGSPWAPAALDASFSGPTLTLTPNSNIDQTDPIDSYWWQAPNDGTTPGNHIMAASMYVEQGNYSGGVVDFTGNVLQNTLVSPYTSVAFIDDFTPSYSLVNTITAPLVNGVFNISLNINPGDVLQYGFITTGPNARVAALPGLGDVEVAGVPEPSSIALIGAGAAGLLGLRRSRKV